MPRARTIDSTQFNLKELQRLEVERIEHELEAKKRRHEQELARREAEARAIQQAQRDAQRAVEEAARAEARHLEEARLHAEHLARIAKIKEEANERARQQEIELRKANADMLQAQAMLRPKRRWWPIVLLAVVFGLQGLGFMWYQDKANANRDAITSELSKAEQRAADAEKAAHDLDAALADAAAELEALQASAGDRTDDTPTAGDAKPEPKKNPKPDPKKPPKPRPIPDPKPDPNGGKIDLSNCDVNSPLGCLKRR